MLLAVSTSHHSEHVVEAGKRWPEVVARDGAPVSVCCCTARRRCASRSSCKNVRGIDVWLQFYQARRQKCAMQCLQKEGHRRQDWQHNKFWWNAVNVYGINVRTASKGRTTVIFLSAFKSTQRYRASFKNLHHVSALIWDYRGGHYDWVCTM